MSKDRKILYSKYNHRYKLFCPDKRSRYICFYCGLPAPTVDHVPPLNKVADLLMEYESLKYIKVPACQECNGIASDFPHIDIYERQEYIKKKLKKKYQKYIKSMDWEEDEIEQLGYRMKQQVIASMSIKYLVAYRLTYGEDTNFKVTDLGYMQFDPRKILKYAEVDKWDSSFEAVDKEQTLEEVNAILNKTAKKRKEENNLKQNTEIKNDYYSYKDFKKFIEKNNQITNGKAYTAYRKNNKKTWTKLPISPSGFYQDLWEGWETVIGSRYKIKQFRVDKEKILSYDDFKKTLQKTDVKNSQDFGKWRRSLSEEFKTQIPSSPKNHYSEWVNWNSLLGSKYKKNSNKIDKTKYLKYEEFKKFLAKSGVKNSKEFPKWRNSLSESEKAKITSQPSSHYSSEWTGWKDLLGDNYETNQFELDYKNMPSYDEFKKILREEHIKTANEFLHWRKNLPSQKKKMIPNFPSIYYKNEWQGWKKALL